MPAIGQSVAEFTAHTFEHSASADVSAASFRAQTLDLIWLMARLAGPIVLGLAAVGVISNLGQSGFSLSLRPLQPEVSRINPLEGFKRICSSRTLVELLKTIAKVGVIGGLAWQALQDKAPLTVSLMEMPAGLAAGVLTDATLDVIWKVSGAFVVIAGADYLYQRWWLARSMRMSLDEVKEEMKQTEGDPQIKARLRQRARALARQRMMQQVPQADVVITNPTHFAVALKYESGMAAPAVIAKGERLLAQQIKKVAREHGVPLVENKPLAQALYKSCQVGQTVPPELFKSVAEVLAFVYRLHPHRAPGGVHAA
jgi:flagellar biosynthetic protein FlhB